MHTVRVAPARLFLQWREYFVGITSSEVAAVLRKWRTEGQRTILRAGMIIDLSSTRSPPQPNPTQGKPQDFVGPLSALDRGDPECIDFFRSLSYS